MRIMQSRRSFVASAAAASLLGSAPALADEGPPETTTIRLPRRANICISPVYIAEDLLRAEGFTDIRYIPLPSDFDATARGEIDFNSGTPAQLAYHLDAGKPFTVLAGVHPGCYELFAHEPIRTISDLKGKRVGIQFRGAGGHLLLVVMAAHVGLDPLQDIDWIESPTGNFMALFAEGKLDAFLAFPPEPQELRARKIGRVILNTTMDKPWSQYFCCVTFGNRDFVRDHPVATKRFLRAILKAADMCAAEPAKAAQRLVKSGLTQQYAYALQTLTELPYARWREFDPEDALRFYALRLRDVGMVKSSPKQIIADGTDWRFLDELKRELKA
jgi:NitT/TauT family transport system substrate-binding protein